MSIEIDFPIMRSCGRGRVGSSRVLRYSRVICTLMNRFFMVVAILGTGYRRPKSVFVMINSERRSRINSRNTRIALYFGGLEWIIYNRSSDLLATSSSTNPDAFSTSACFCARAINKATSSAPLSSVFPLVLPMFKVRETDVGYMSRFVIVPNPPKHSNNKNASRLFSNQL